MLPCVSWSLAEAPVSSNDAVRMPNAMPPWQAAALTSARPNDQKRRLKERKKWRNQQLRAKKQELFALMDAQELLAPACLHTLLMHTQELLAEKDASIGELRETVDILEIKIQKLEQLVRLKDSKIATLQAKLQQQPM